MGAYELITLALRSSLLSLNLPHLIAYDGRDFDPETISGDIFIAEFFLFSDQVSLTKKELDEVIGIYQLSIHQRAGGNIIEVARIVDALANHYQHNAKFVQSTQTVVIINTTRNGGRNIDGWYVVDVSVSFKSDRLRV